MHYPLAPDKIRTALRKRLDEYESELAALQGVTINTKLATLTNRAVSGDGVRIGDYIGIGKALYVSYTIEYASGGKRYECCNITAYAYNNPDGSVIGVNGFLKLSRTITPAELNDQLQQRTTSITGEIAKLKAEYRRADAIARRHNKLVDAINAYNEIVSYSSEAQIR